MFLSRNIYNNHTNYVDIINNIQYKTGNKLIAMIYCFELKIKYTNLLSSLNNIVRSNNCKSSKIKGL